MTALGAELKGAMREVKDLVIVEAAKSRIRVQRAAAKAAFAVFAAIAALLVSVVLVIELVAGAGSGIAALAGWPEWAGRSIAAAAGLGAFALTGLFLLRRSERRVVESAQQSVSSGPAPTR